VFWEEAGQGGTNRSRRSHAGRCSTGEVSRTKRGGVQRVVVYLLAIWHLSKTVPNDALDDDTRISATRCDTAGRGFRDVSVITERGGGSV
jgi:hypothetical protein